MNDELKKVLKDEISCIKTNAKGFTLYGLRKNSSNNTFICNCPIEFSGEFLLSARGFDETHVSITYIDGKCVIEGIESDREFFDNAIIKQDDSVFLKPQLEVIESKDFELNEVIKNPAIIVGPPGTGKTAVITKIVKEAIKNKEKVLVVSPTNMAVENVFEKLYPDFLEMGLNDDDIILQIKTEDEALIKFSPKSIANEKTNVIQDELDVLNVGLDDIVRDIRDIEPLLNIELDKLDLNKTKINNLEKDKIKKLQDKATFENDIKSLTKRIDTLESNILVKAVASAFAGTKVDEIKNQKEQLEKKVNCLIIELADIEKKIDEVQNEELTKSIGEFRNRLSNLRDTKKQITERIKTLNDEKEDLINLDFFSNKKLVGITLVGAALNKKIQKGDFDKIIIDEASMASLPSLYLACSSVKKWDSNRKNIIVSDFGHYYEAQQEAIKLSVNSQFIFVGDPKQRATC
jgi:superfamily I DNA/RNA helicase